MQKLLYNVYHLTQALHCHNLTVITSPPDRGANYCDQRVCLFVCLSVCSRDSTKQSLTSDFASGAFTWLTRLNNVVLDFGPLAFCVKT